MVETGALGLKTVKYAFLSTSADLSVYLVLPKSTEINGGFLRIIHVSVASVEPVDLLGNVY